MKRTSLSSRTQIELRASRLASDRAEWLAFLRRRVGSEPDAEDLLQSALAKAMRRAGEVRSDESLKAWFYRVLRYALADHHRKSNAERHRLALLQSDLQAGGDDNVRPTAEEALALCACLLPRMKTLRPRYAELLRSIDLEGQSPADVAKAHRLTRNTLDVTLHRAREALRRELERFCGECAVTGACLECECPPPAEHGREKRQM